MIFVTVGSSKIPFDRLIRHADRLAADYEVLVQKGPSSVRFDHAKSVDFLAYEELIEYMRAARVVITHAGVGSIIAALSAQRRPIVVPRRRVWQEAVDDHQVELARRLGGAGLVTALENPDGLCAAVEGPSDVSNALATDGALVRELRGVLTAWVKGPVEIDALLRQ